MASKWLPFIEVVNSVKKMRRPMSERTCSRLVCRFCDCLRLFAELLRRRHHLIAMAVEKPMHRP